MELSIFALVVCLAGVLTSATGALYWQIVFCLFGAAGAITLTSIGGAVITPSNLFLPFLVVRAWAEQYGRSFSRRVPVAGVWLGLAVSYGVLGAICSPRFFYHELDVLTMDRTGGSIGVVLYPLHPVSGNITQSGYALGGLAAFLSVRALLEKPQRMRHFRDAVLLLATLNCIAALLNLGEYHLGLPATLTYVRNAYALFDAYEIAGTGLMRIHGTFSETAAFCAFTLPLFAFTFSLWMSSVRSLYTGTLSLLLLTFLLLSTSTTAYVGLALYGFILLFVLTYRGYVRGTVPRIGLLVSGALLAAALVGSFFVLDTAIGRKLEDYFAITVFNKLDSASGVERSEWNRQAWSNFIDTYGIGVGLGSARASSLPLVLLSNFGLLGTLAFGAFLKRLFRPVSSTPETSATIDAARQAVLGALSAGLVSCTVFDLGITFYAYAAAASYQPLVESLYPNNQTLRG